MTSAFTLFVTAFLGATLLPAPSEAVLALSIRQHGNVPWLVAIASAGNILGACTTFALARGLFAHRLAGEANPHPRAVALFTRYGAPTLLLSWLPVVGDAFVALAGAAAMPFWRFLGWMAAGKVARYVVVAWAAARTL